jgi:hypothetical protein
MTLCPVKSLFELVEVVVSNAKLPDPLKWKIFYLWSLIDAENRPGLRTLCRVVHSHPGITVPLLLEIFPMAANLHSPAYRNPVEGSTAVPPPRQIVHAEDAEAAISSSQPEGNAEDSEAIDDDLSHLRSAEDREFWSKLVS